MTVHATAVATLWEDLLQRSALPPRVAGVTNAEYEVARLVQEGPIRTVEASASETWIWSDLHLRDRGVIEAGRPFRNVRAMEDRMLEAWTNNVPAGGTIICLGDVSHPEAFEDEDLVARVKACPGRRLLVLGNHDVAYRSQLGRLGFVDQVAAAITVTDPPVALTHMPLARIPPGAVHLHGHLHGKGKQAPRRRDVSVDVIDFAPRRLDWLLEDLAAERLRA